MTGIKIDKIIRSKRKTIALIVNQDATLIVKAPQHTSMDYINDLVQKKRSWIIAKQAQIRLRPSYHPKEFVNGESFRFLGKDYRLEIVTDDKDQIYIQEKILIPSYMLPEAQKHLIKWYKQKALERISERIQRYSIIAGFKPLSVKITDAQKRWGSCGNKGTLNFSWRLVLAPLNIIDYVVLHELIHLQEKNHSSRFKNKIRTIMPDFEKRERWLKENGHLLKL